MTDTDMPVGEENLFGKEVYSNDDPITSDTFDYDHYENSFGNRFK
jgi:hypothetical protein